MNLSKTSIIIIVILSFGAGTFAGAKFLAPALTQHHYTEKIIEKETKVEGEAKTEVKTQIAYVPKEAAIVKYINPAAGEEVSQTQLEKADIEAQVGKQEINVRLNGKEVAFEKSDDERFVFEKNKIALNQTSTVTFDVKVEPPVINRTKRWGIGVGYGSNGPAGKIDFPVGKNDLFGGWVYGDKKTGAAGVTIKF